MQYLVFQSDDTDPDRMLITNAATPEGAKQNYAYKMGIKEQWFQEDVYTRSVNMSFAERFYLQSQEELDRFSVDGTILIDQAEFERRVRRLFASRPPWARLYLSMWNDQETPQDMLHVTHPFPDDMLIFMYLNYDAPDDGLTVVPTQDLKRR